MNKSMPSRKEIVAVLVVTVLLGIILKTTFQYSRETKRLSMCQSNLKQLNLALLQYARDYDEYLPLQSNWMDSLAPYRKEMVVHCPSASTYGYAMNRKLAGADSDVIFGAIDTRTTEPTFFDAPTSQRNAVGDEKSWMTPGRHRGGNNVGFSDGRVEWLQVRPVFNGIPMPTPRPTSAPAPPKKEHWRGNKRNE